MILTTLYVPSTTLPIDRLFSIWLEHALSATTAPIVVLTTGDKMQTVAPGLGVSVLHIDMSGFNPRPGVNENGQFFDMKGELICRALPLLGDNVLYTDMDAFLQKDPASHLPAGHGVMIPPDANTRPFTPPFSKQAYKRGCAGVLWFPGQHKTAMEVFRACRAHLIDSPQGTDWLLEQWAWTWAAHKTGGLLPAKFNYVPHLDKNGPKGDAVIHHWHGNHKWSKIEKGEW